MPSSVWRLLARHPFIASYVTAVLLRLTVAYLAPGHAADTATYKAAADAFRSSPLTDSQAFLLTPPLFPVFLALTPNDTVALGLEIVLVSLIAPLLGVATTRHFGRAAGTITAFLAASEPNFVVWSTFLLTDSFGLLFFAAAIERTSKVLGTGGSRASFVGGVGIGLAWLTRAAYAVPAAVLAGFSTLFPGLRPIRGALFGAGVVLILAIPIARNTVAIGEPTLYRNLGWQLIWYGTMWNEVGRGTVGVDVILPSNFSSLSPAEREGLARDRSIVFVTENPSRYVTLLFKKALWLWLPAYPEWSLVHKLATGGYFSVLYVVALLGFVGARRSTFAWLLITLIAVTVLTVMVTIVDYDGRYRLPAEVCLLPLAGLGGSRLVARVRNILSRRAAAEPSPA